jgi:hypothetical protein
MMPVPRALLNRSKRYGPSILEQIRAASTVSAVRKFMQDHLHGASSGTKRKWLRAAERRIGVLEAA